MAMCFDQLFLLMKRGKHAFHSVFRNRSLSILICTTASLVISTIFLYVRDPVPGVHDEFSYLLCADTFLEKRLTNPAHPMWPHFESMHIIQQPSYASKYQPGQGAILAFGKVLTGHPIAGAILSTALAAAAVCWMLQGWVPLRWALYGGLILALHGQIQAKWALSFWGGSLSMVGGALMFGALPRIYSRNRPQDSIVLAIGAIILAATRPFEGVVVGLCVSIALLCWMVSSKSPPFKNLFSNLVLPAAAVVILGLCALVYYNMQVTGNPFKIPYQVYEETYGYGPIFLWLKPGEEPQYQHKVLQDFNTGFSIRDYNKQQNLTGWLNSQYRTVTSLKRFFFNYATLLPLISLPFLLLSKRLRFIWFFLLLFFFAESSVPWMFPHYFSPVAPLIFLILIQGIRYLKTINHKGHRWPRFIAPLIFIFCIFDLSYDFHKYATRKPHGWKWERSQIVSDLEKTEVKHLILVRYAPKHDAHHEWVYNNADIDNSKIVWAREMGAPHDNELSAYFKDRQIWLLEADQAPRQLMPYRRE